MDQQNTGLSHIIVRPTTVEVLTQKLGCKTQEQIEPQLENLNIV